MIKVRIISIYLCVVSLFLFVSCGSNIKSDETYREQYVAAYRGASIALDISNNTQQSVTMLIDAVSADNFYIAFQSAQDDFENCYKPADESPLKSTRGFVYFLYLLYKNNVPITQAPITLDCDYIMNNQTIQDNSITLLSEIDLINNRIVGNVIGVSAESGANRDTDEFYIHIEIDFDFNSHTIGGFTLDMIGIAGDNLSFENGVSCLYKNGKVYTAYKSDLGNKLDEYVEFVEETYYKPYKGLTAKAVKINKNYSKEYTESMNRFVM